MEPLVTVIIGTYNRARLLPGAIDSVLEQGFTSYELLVIDNGSTDETRAVVERYTDHRVIYILNDAPTTTCASPRNIGIQRARGRYIAFLDDDDRWHPEKLRICMRELERHPEAVLVCHAQQVIHEGTAMRINLCGPWCDDIYERLLYEGNRLGPGSVLIMKEALQRIGGFDTRERYADCEDYDLWIRLAESGAKFHFISDPLTEFHLTGFNGSLVNPYVAGRVAEMIRGHMIRHEGGEVRSTRGRARLASLNFYAARTLHKAGRWREAIRQYGKAGGSGWPGVKRLIGEVWSSRSQRAGSFGAAPLASKRVEGGPHHDESRRWPS